eukprot:COSAG06_NODE_29788_length_550_cov_1.019956_1_plen_66_part_01
MSKRDPFARPRAGVFRGKGKCPVCSGHHFSQVSRVLTLLPLGLGTFSCAFSDAADGKSPLVPTMVA